MMMTATLDQARAAKATAREKLGSALPVSAIGIEKRTDGFGLKVNLSRRSARHQNLPAEVDGVPVRYEVVGKIRRLSAAGA